MNCFNCEMERACNTYSKLLNQKKTYSTDMNMLKAKPPSVTKCLLGMSEIISQEYLLSISRLGKKI